MLYQDIKVPYIVVAGDIFYFIVLSNEIVCFVGSVFPEVSF